MSMLLRALELSSEGHVAVTEKSDTVLSVLSTVSVLPLIAPRQLRPACFSVVRRWSPHCSVDAASSFFPMLPDDEEVLL
jgi:hypothetical protein